MCKHLNLNCPSTAKTTSLGVANFPDVKCQAYLFHKSCSPSSTCFASGKAFIFDSEHYALMKSAHDYALYVSILNQFVANPVILFFITADNIQVGLRFPSEKEALIAFHNFQDFKSVLAEPTLQSNKK